MKEQKKLTIGMAIFSFTVFVAFGVIILNEKTAPYYATRINTKFNEYLNTNYTNIVNELATGKTTYKNTEYKLKITSKKNKNLYFYVKYSNRKITDTYKEDYLEGKTLLNKISNDIEKELQKKYNKNFKINFLTTLNELNEQKKEIIINEENVTSLPIYSLETEIDTTWTIESIQNEITLFHNNLIDENINPNSYILTINDLTKKNKSIKIKNLKPNIIENNLTLTEILNDIINGKNSELLEKYKITYEQI